MGRLTRTSILMAMVAFLHPGLETEPLSLVATADAAPRGAAGRSAGRKARRKPARRASRERRVPWLTAGGLPNIQAQAALVIDLDTGTELYRRNPDQVRAIASLSKLAAALVVMDRGLNLDGLTTITRAESEVARGGATSRLLEGMVLTNRDLLHAAMLGSDNRAVPALGRAVGLGPAELAAAMTRKARQLGLRHTRFLDPTGLSTDNVSTARETIALLRAVMTHPVLGPVARTLEYEAHPQGRYPVRYVNTHKPAHRSHIEVLGGKTGFNNVARYCLVIATRVDGRSYGMAFLGAEGKLTRFGDVSRTSDWIVARKPLGPSTQGVAAVLTPPAAGTAAETGTAPAAPAAAGGAGAAASSQTAPGPTQPAGAGAAGPPAGPPPPATPEPAAAPGGRP